MSPSAMSNMLSGATAIGKSRAQALHDAYGFDVGFLLTGVGSLIPGRGNAYAARPAENTPAKAPENAPSEAPENAASAPQPLPQAASPRTPKATGTDAPGDLYIKVTETAGEVLRRLDRIEAGLRRLEDGTETAWLRRMVERLTATDGTENRPKGGKE